MTAELAPVHDMPQTNIYPLSVMHLPVTLLVAPLQCVPSHIQSVTSTLHHHDIPLFDLSLVGPDASSEGVHSAAAFRSSACGAVRVTAVDGVLTGARLRSDGAVTPVVNLSSGSFSCNPIHRDASDFGVKAVVAHERLT